MVAVRSNHRRAGSVSGISDGLWALLLMLYSQPQLLRRCPPVAARGNGGSRRTSDRSSANRLAVRRPVLNSQISTPRPTSGPGCGGRV